RGLEPLQVFLERDRGALGIDSQHATRIRTERVQTHSYRISQAILGFEQEHVADLARRSIGPLSPRRHTGGQPESGIALAAFWVADQESELAARDAARPEPINLLWLDVRQTYQVKPIG